MSITIRRSRSGNGARHPALTEFSNVHETVAACFLPPEEGGGKPDEGLICETRRIPLVCLRGGVEWSVGATVMAREHAAADRLPSGPQRPWMSPGRRRVRNVGPQPEQSRGREGRMA